MGLFGKTEVCASTSGVKTSADNIAMEKQPSIAARFAVFRFIVAPIQIKVQNTARISAKRIFD
jgi:hypothetical protein